MSVVSESTPPDPLDGEWFVHLGGKIFGPFTGHEIQKKDPAAYNSPSLALPPRSPLRVGAFR